MKFFFQKPKLDKDSLFLSDRRYKIIFDVSPEALILIDAKGTFIDVNGRITDWLGYDKNEVIGKNIGNIPFLSEKYKALTAENFKKRMSGAEIPPYDIEFICKNGGKKLGRIRGAVIRDGKGNPIGDLIFAADITNLVSLEDKLQREKDKLNLIVNSMGEGLLLVNKEYKIELINSAGARLLGVKEEDALGKKWFEFAKAYIGSSEIPFEKRVSSLVLSKGVTYITELEANHYYLIKSSGRKFPIISITTPLIIDGEVIGAVKVFRDASIEKEARIIIEEKIKSGAKALKEEQIRTNFILDNIGEGIILTDSSGFVTYINPAFKNLTGFNDNDLFKKDFSEVVIAYDLDGKPIPPSQMSDAAAITAHKQEMKVKVGKKDNNQVEVVINASPIKVDSKYIGLVRVLHDYSEDFKLQQQKDDFFSIASHELRTPLSVIDGNLDTILAGYGKSTISPSDMQLLLDSTEASERLIKLVSDFLNVSRIDQGRLKYEITEVDMCFVIESIVRQMTALSNKKKINLSFHCVSDPKHKMIMGDEGLLREILINLVGNSIKFTNKGEIILEHGIKDNMSYLKISDTGIGIALDKQYLLFQRFQQAMDKTLARQAGGTGLGLYISREFARVMGGDLYLVESEEGN